MADIGRSERCFQHPDTPTLQRSVWSSSFDNDFVHPAAFGEAHMNAFVVRGGKVFPDKIGRDRQFAVAAIDQDGELNASWPAEIIQGVHRCTDRATAEEHVIHEHDGFSAHVEWYQCGLNIWSDSLIQVVAVHADVQGARWHRMAPNARQQSA